MKLLRVVKQRNVQSSLQQFRFLNFDLEFEVSVSGVTGGARPLQAVVNERKLSSMSLNGGFLIMGRSKYLTLTRLEKC